MSDLNINNLINAINSRGFYTWLIKDEDYKNQNGEDYCGTCPCFYWKIKDYDIVLHCSCWRSGDFEYSGLKVIDINNKYNYIDLENLALTILSFITEIWTNTDWQYEINNEGKVKYGNR